LVHLGNRDRMAPQKGFNFGKASTRNPLASSLGGPGVDGGEISFLQIRIITEDFILSHTRCEHIQHVPDSHSQAADARLARTLPRENCDAGKVSPVTGSHEVIITAPAGSAQTPL
jgi:hypothetical protein